MNILFILGNGFDINLGLKTRYQEFYDVYSKSHNLDDSVMKLKDHISKHTDGYWSDLEIALGKYTKEFKSVEEFDLVMDDIIISLSKYLKSIEEHFSKFSIDKEKFFNDLAHPERYLIPTQEEEINKFKRDYQNVHWDINIVTFNYTNIVEQIIGNLENPEIGYHLDSNKSSKIKNILMKNVEHIHGFVDNRMILGVNDLSQVANNDLHNDIDIQESIIKSQCNEANGEKSSIHFSNKIDQANLICVFGLSFGDSDKIWWEKLGKRLATSNSRMLIFDKAININQILSHKNNRLRRQTKNHFLQQTSLPKNLQDSISSRIYVGINTNMFSEISDNKKILKMKAS